MYINEFLKKENIEYEYKTLVWEDNKTALCVDMKYKNKIINFLNKISAKEIDYFYFNDKVAFVFNKLI